MYDSVLVATDGDERSEDVLAHALSIAADNDATLHGLYVVDRRVYSVAFDDGPSEKKAELREAGEAALARVREAAGEAGVAVETDLREGDPERVVSAFADEIDVDLVVVGSHGKSPKEKVQGLGSVSEATVKSTTRPVLVVGITDDE
jgi:nucleotide-binding universal stress UspA family protein